MDPITFAIASLQNPLLDALGRFLDVYSPFLFLSLALLIYVFYEKVRSNRMRILSFFVALILVLAIVMLLKQIPVPRPCIESISLLKLGSCPIDSSFPSLHTAFGFVFAAASLGTSFFPVFFILAVLTGLSRILVGVHTITDVTAGVAIGLSAYFAVVALVRAYLPSFVPKTEKFKEEKAKKAGAVLEIRRDVAHALFGTSMVVIALMLGVPAAEVILLCCLFIGMVCIQLRIKKAPIPIIDHLFDVLERPGVMPAMGAFTYVVGALLALSFLPAMQACAVIAALAWGDSSATVFGTLFGKTKWFHNKKKSIIGTVSFMLFGGIAANLIIGPIGFLLAAILATVETVDSKIDDNLLIPVVGVLFFIALNSLAASGFALL